MGGGGSIPSGIRNSNDASKLPTNKGEMIGGEGGGGGCIRSAILNSNDESKHDKIEYIHVRTLQFSISDDESMHNKIGIY